MKFKPCAKPKTWPTAVNIAGSKYDVKYGTQLHLDDGTELWGVVMRNKRAIVIDADQTADAKKEVLFHEMAHAYMFSCPPPIDVKTFERQEESLCNYLAGFVLDVLRNNPGKWE